MTQDCESFESRLVEGADEADVAAHVAECSSCAAFREDLVELRQDVSEYRETVLAEVGPSAEFSGRIDRMLVQLVQDDVRERFRKTTRGSATRAITGLGETWRWLVEASAVFRWATKGAVAFGVGLLFAMVLDVVSVMDAPTAGADLLPERSPLVPQEAPEDPAKVTDEPDATDPRRPR